MLDFIHPIGRFIRIFLKLVFLWQEIRDYIVLNSKE
ncbi:MAG: hypothetical protein RL713_1440, partial [Bacteroidota bacterium]